MSFRLKANDKLVVRLGDATGDDSKGGSVPLASMPRRASSCWPLLMGTWQARGQLARTLSRGARKFCGVPWGVQDA